LDTGSDTGLDVVSPELVLVSSPEEARRSRELLPEEPWARLVPPTETETTTPVPKPQARLHLVTLDEPSPTRRLRPTVLAILLGAALAAAGYLAERTWLGSDIRQSGALPAGTSATGSAAPVLTTLRAQTGFVPSRAWSWAPAAADAYEVTFYLNGRIVLHTRVNNPHMLLPQSFRFQAGRYRWTVRALPSAPGAPPIADSSFSLSSAAAAAGNRQ